MMVRYLSNGSMLMEKTPEGYRITISERHQVAERWIGDLYQTGAKRVLRFNPKYRAKDQTFSDEEQAAEWLEDVWLNNGGLVLPGGWWITGRPVISTLERLN